MFNPYGNPYMPSTMTPYQMQQQAMGINPMQQFMQQNGTINAPTQQPVSSLIRVTGADGAKAYPMAPNSVAALFDDTRDVFYVKTSDAGSFSTIKAYAFTPLIEQQQQPNVPIQANTANEYATRQEVEFLQKQLEEVKGLIENGKQSVSEQQPTNDQRARNAK